MPITITRDQLAAMNPCGLTEQLKPFGKRESLTVTQALQAGATVPDVLWVAGRLGLRDQIETFANGCAAAAAAWRAEIDAADAAARQTEIDRQQAHLMELFA